MEEILFIPFDNTKLIAVNHDDEIYIAMRPIVEGMGLSWSRQAQKLKKYYKKYRCVHMSTPTSSGHQEMLFLPIKKLNGWLFSINPEKVRIDLKDTIIKYQEECFVVLYEYWNKGEAIREKVQIELNEWRLRESNSFQKASEAGKKLNIRKKEKYFFTSQIERCEFNLIQPDLFK